MAKASIENIVRELVEDAINTNGYELVDVEYTKEGKEWFLRIFIDNESGISLDDCEFISHKVEEILDKEDPITTGYILQISSPGIERPLKKREDYLKYQGKLIMVKLYTAINKDKHLKGILAESNEEGIYLKIKDSSQFIEWNNISRAHLTFEF